MIHPGAMLTPGRSGFQKARPHRRTPSNRPHVDRQMHQDAAINLKITRHEPKHTTLPGAAWQVPGRCIGAALSPQGRSHI